MLGVTDIIAITTFTSAFIWYNTVQFISETFQKKRKAIQARLG